MLIGFGVHQSCSDVVTGCRSNVRVFSLVVESARLLFFNLLTTTLAVNAELLEVIVQGGVLLKAAELGRTDVSLTSKLKCLEDGK